MTLSHLVALLTAISLNANPSPHAIPVTINAKNAPVETPAPPAPPIKKRPESLGVVVTSKSAIVVDVASGAVLFAKDAKVERSVASLTKLLTAMVVLDQGLRPDDSITIEGADFVDARPVFAAGDTMTRGDAIRAMLTGSINELANAFARISEGGRAGFIEAMNAKARMLGLEKTTIEEPTGINPRNRATAADVARLLRSALGYPTIRETTTADAFDLRITAGPSAGVNGRSVRVKPTNLLLPTFLNNDPYRIVAGKTGSLAEAGFCLAQATERDGHQIIAVTLGSVDHLTRFQDVKAMTAWAFETYEWR